MTHTFTVRDKKGVVSTMTVSATTRATAAAWIDRGPFTIVSVIKR